MRIASRTTLVSALALIALGRPAHSQESPHAEGDEVIRSGYHELYGKSYARADLESFEILGVHLGMPFADAKRKVLAQGFEPNGESGFLKHGAIGTLDWISFKVTGFRKRITAISYSRSLGLKTEEGRAAARDELLSRFGKPTVWLAPERGKDLVESMHWLTPDSIVNSQRRYETKVCGFHWECDLILNHKDCRPLVKDAHGIALEVVLLHPVNQMDYQLYDMDAELKEARSSKRFWAMDVRKAACMIPQDL